MIAGRGWLLWYLNKGRIVFTSWYISPIGTSNLSTRDKNAGHMENEEIEMPG
jgi:hypothetical protein